MKLSIISESIEFKVINNNLDIISKEVSETFPAGPRRNEALQALQPSKWNNVIAAFENGQIVGVASFWKDADTENLDGVKPGEYIRIRDIGTMKNGVGKLLVQKVEEYASKLNAGVSAISLSDATRFWESLGFTNAVGMTYYKPLI